MKRLAGERERSSGHRNRCRASCSSSSTNHHYSGRGTTRYGYRSDCAELYKTPSVPPPFEATYDLRVESNSASQMR
jgi:hypothetical protein